MKFMEYMQKLETIKYLSQHKQTGTPQQLASKLHISERTLRRMLEQLRDNGCPVIYNRFRYSYVVEEFLK